MRYTLYTIVAIVAYIIGKYIYIYINIYICVDMYIGYCLYLYICTWHAYNVTKMISRKVIVRYVVVVG